MVFVVHTRGDALSNASEDACSNWKYTNAHSGQSYYGLIRERHDVSIKMFISRLHQNNKLSTVLTKVTNGGLEIEMKSD